MCYDLAHQIRCAKHTFSGRCDITPMVCCSFGGHSTPQFLQCSVWYLASKVYASFLTNVSEFKQLNKLPVPLNFEEDMDVDQSVIY